MVSITIIEERLQGESDVDLSIVIPETGDIKEEIKDVPSGTPKITKFTEHHNWARRDLRSFPAVRVSDFYMVWVAERKEWVGLRFEYKGSHFEGERQGIEEYIDASGPYKLNAECARLISQIYKNTDVSLDDVLCTEPEKLIGSELELLLDFGPTVTHRTGLFSELPANPDNKDNIIRIPIKGSLPKICLGVEPNLAIFKMVAPRKAYLHGSIATSAYEAYEYGNVPAVFVTNKQYFIYSRDHYAHFEHGNEPMVGDDSGLYATFAQELILPWIEPREEWIVISHSIWFREPKRYVERYSSPFSLDEICSSKILDAYHILDVAREKNKPEQVSKISPVQLNFSH